MKLTSNSQALYIIEESGVYTADCNYLGYQSNGDFRKFTVTLNSQTGKVSYGEVLLSDTLLSSDLKSLLRELPKRELYPEEAFMIAGRAYRLWRTHGSMNDIFIVSTFEISKLFDFGARLSDVDIRLQDIIYSFYRTYPDKVLTLEDIFISCEFDIDLIATRMNYFKKRGILEPYFSNSMDAGKMEKNLNLSDWQRVSTLRMWGDEKGYLLTPDGFEKLEKVTPVTGSSKNRYFQLVDIPAIRNKKFAFVLMPFNPDKFDQSYYFDVIKPTMENGLNIMCIRADDISEPGVINNQIYTCIEKAEIVIAELTTENQNVAIELGMTLRADQPVFLLTQIQPEKLFFDIRDKRTILYNSKTDLKEKLIEKIGAYLKRTVPATISR